MVKQSAAAQRKADAEARKAAKAAKGSTAAAGSTTAVADSSQAAVAAGPQASKGTAKQARAASETALPPGGAQAGAAVATAGGRKGKADLQTDADSSQVKQSDDPQVCANSFTSKQTSLCCKLPYLYVKRLYTLVTAVLQ